MCKGGSKKTTSTETGTTHNTGTNTGWTGGSPLALGYATDALDAFRKGGPRQIADFNPFMMRQLDEADRAGQATFRDLDKAGYAFDRAGQNVSLGPLDVERYFNPYSSYVEDGLNRDLGIKAINNRMTNTSVAGGVGGDRIAVGEALNREADQMARGRLRANVWDTATGVAADQQGRQYAADVGNRQNQYSLGSALMSRYGYGQDVASKGAGTRQGLAQARNDAGYQYNTDYLNAVRGLAPIFGTSFSNVSDTSGTSTKHGEKEETTKSDPLSSIVGAAMTLGPMMMGLPPMGGGMGGGGKGGGIGGGAAGSVFGDISGFDFSGAGYDSYTGKKGKSGSPFSGWGFRRGGRVNPWMPKAGGGLIYEPEDYNPVDEALDTSPRGRFGASMPTPDQVDQEHLFRDAFVKPFDERFGESEPTPDQLGSEEGLRRRALNPSMGFGVPTTRSVAPPPAALPPPVEPPPPSPPAMASRSPAAATDDYDINLPPEPKFGRYSRPERNWSELLFRAGLATLAASGDTDSSGIPKPALANIGKGFVTALDSERKDREDSRKEFETDNYNVAQQDSALMRREGLKINRMNAQDANEERALRRQELNEYRLRKEAYDRDKFEETKRKNAADEARKMYVAQARDEQIRMGKPFSDDNIVYKAQVRADNWRKAKIAEINAGVLKKKDIDLDQGWQDVFNSTRDALKQAQQDALSRMRRPAPVTP